MTGSGCQGGGKGQSNHAKKFMRKYRPPALHIDINGNVEDFVLFIMDGTGTKSQANRSLGVSGTLRLIKKRRLGAPM